MISMEEEHEFTAKCAECKAIIIFKKNPNLGDPFICLNCSTLPEVVSLSPLLFYWGFEYDIEMEAELAEV